MNVMTQAGGAPADGVAVVVGRPRRQADPAISSKGNPLQATARTGS